MSDPQLTETKETTEPTRFEFVMTGRSAAWTAGLLLVVAVVSKILDVVFP